MSEYFRHKELLSVFLAQLAPYPATVRGGIAPDVFGYVERPASTTAYQFVLPLWRGLKMQSSDSACVCREREVVLAKINLNPRMREMLAVPSFSKEASIVTEAGRRHNQNVWKCSIGYFEHR